MTRHARITTDDKLDRYYSPQWAVELLVEHLERVHYLRPPSCIAEPCAGRGHIVRPLEERGYQVLAGDIDPDSPYPQADATGDVSRYAGADWIITNPPYAAATGSAADVMRNLLTLGKPTAALLRITWLEPCGERADFFTKPRLMPSKCLVLPRVHYEGPNGGDNNPAASMWVLWLPDRQGPTRMEWWTAGDKAREKGQEMLI